MFQRDRNGVGDSLREITLTQRRGIHGLQYNVLRKKLFRLNGKPHEESFFSGPPPPPSSLVVIKTPSPKTTYESKPKESTGH